MYLSLLHIIKTKTGTNKSAIYYTLALRSQQIDRDPLYYHFINNRRQQASSLIISSCSHFKAAGTFAASSTTGSAIANIQSSDNHDINNTVHFLSNLSPISHFWRCYLKTRQKLELEKSAIHINLEKSAILNNIEKSVTHNILVLSVKHLENKTSKKYIWPN